MEFPCSPKLSHSLLFCKFPEHLCGSWRASSGSCGTGTRDIEQEVIQGELVAVDLPLQDLFLKVNPAMQDAVLSIVDGELAILRNVFGNVRFWAARTKHIQCITTPV